MQSTPDEPNTSTHNEVMRHALLVNKIVNDTAVGIENNHLGAQIGYLTVMAQYLDFILKRMVLTVFSEENHIRNNGFSISYREYNLTNLNKKTMGQMLPVVERIELRRDDGNHNLMNDLAERLSRFVNDDRNNLIHNLFTTEKISSFTEFIKRVGDANIEVTALVELAAEIEKIICKIHNLNAPPYALWYLNQIDDWFCMSKADIVSGKFLFLLGLGEALVGYLVIKQLRLTEPMRNFQLGLVLVTRGVD